MFSRKKLCFFNVGYNFFKNILLNFIIYNMYIIYLHGFFFIIFSYKILKLIFSKNFLG